MLRVRHTVTALHICIDEVAMAAINIIKGGLLARIDAALDVEAAIAPVRQAHVGLLTIAVKWRLNGSSAAIVLDTVAHGGSRSGIAGVDVYMMIYQISMCYKQLV
jgi:hypothetical protein